ncbi:MAG: hypothetical protein IPK82_12600 [Polyangiaceae bacterium]|nr:hypothetical protein [Polyangiaceae bacterium]
MKFFSSVPLKALAVSFTLLFSAGGAACQGCQPGPPASAGDLGATPDKPTLRLYAISSVAGALEPCGCSKDQLGGIHYAAAFIAAEKAAAPNAWVLGAGPLFFMDPDLRTDDRQQTLWKAEAIAQASKHMGLTAFVPGLNDWAGGADTLTQLGTATGGALLAGNLEGVAGAVPTLLKEISGVKVGLFGLADPKDKTGRTPPGVKALPINDGAKKAIADLKARGASILIGMVAAPRGEALRLADNFPELNVLILGKPVEVGDINDAPKPPILAGSTLVVETSNHLQTVGVVDLYLAKGDEKAAAVTFQDAGGVAKAEELLALTARIRDLEQKLNGWEGNKDIKPEDLAARRMDLEKMRGEKAKLEGEQTPTKGSFFKYKLVEVRDRLGAEKTVFDQMATFYKRVNEHNKTAFADRKPTPPEKGQAGFIGIDACTDCHDEERKVWDGTQHAKAYATLQKDFKEYNLDCVSCHVTGYGKPGGSTVTFNDKLQNIQCETCHGPGSLHAKDPNKKGLITLKPAPETCTSECHHPPHVEGFDPAAKMKLILGPGHGQ